MRGQKRKEPPGFDVLIEAERKAREGTRFSTKLADLRLAVFRKLDKRAKKAKHERQEIARAEADAANARALADARAASQAAAADAASSRLALDATAAELAAEQANRAQLEARFAAIRDQAAEDAKEEDDGGFVGGFVGGGNAEDGVGVGDGGEAPQLERIGPPRPFVEFLEVMAKVRVKLYAERRLRAGKLGCFVRFLGLTSDLGVAFDLVSASRCGLHEYAHRISRDIFTCLRDDDWDDSIVSIETYNNACHRTHAFRDSIVQAEAYCRAAGGLDEAAELLAQLVKATDFDALHRDLDAYALADLPHDEDAYTSTTALRALNISVEEARKLVLAAASIKT